MESIATAVTPSHKTGDLRRTVIVICAVCALLVAGARLAWFTPTVQEWRLSRASLPELLKERGSLSGDSRLLYHIGYRLNQEGRFAEAESNLRRAVGIDPDSPRLRDEWARSQLGTGAVTEAFNQLHQFTGAHPNSSPGHTNLGKFYFTLKSLQRSREELEKAVALDPANAEAWAYLSQATGQLNVPERPLEAARKAVELAPKVAGYRLLLASLLEPTNHPEEAGQEFARAVELAPDNAATHQQYAAWLYKHSSDPAGRAKSEVEVRKALSLDTNDGASYLLLGRLLRDAGKQADAITPLLEAAKRIPEDPAPSQMLFQTYATLGNTAESAKWEALWKSRQDYISRRQDLYFRLGATPNSRELRQQLARLLGTHGDVDGSLRNYAMALRRPIDSVQTLTAAARDLTEGGFADRAIPLAEQAVAKGPRSPEAHEAFGDALLQSGRLNEAIAQYNFTTNHQPNRAPEIQKRVDRYAAAHPQSITLAEQAYREALGLINGQIGLRRTPTRALELAEKANALEDGNIVYMKLLLTLQFGAKKINEAIATARRIVEITPNDAKTQMLLGVMLADRASTPAQFHEAELFLNEARNDPAMTAQRHYGMGLLALHRNDGQTAVMELSEAARLDPAADVTFYKLSQAYRMSGDAKAAEKALAEYESRQKLNREEFGLQSNISQKPDEPDSYRKLAEYYDRNGRTEEASKLREIMNRRFDSSHKNGNSSR